MIDDFYGNIHYHYLLHLLDGHTTKVTLSSYITCPHTGPRGDSLLSGVPRPQAVVAAGQQQHKHGLY